MRERETWIFVFNVCLHDHLKHKDLKKDIIRTICDARGFDLSYCFQRNSVIFSVWIQNFENRKNGFRGIFDFHVM